MVHFGRGGLGGHHTMEGGGAATEPGPGNRYDNKASMSYIFLCLTPRFTVTSSHFSFGSPSHRSLRIKGLVLTNINMCCNASLWCQSCLHFSPNSVATLRGSYGQVRTQCSTEVGRIVCGNSLVNFHKMALVKCPCAFRLRRLAQNVCPGIGVRHFPVNFHAKWLL